MIEEFRKIPLFIDLSDDELKSVLGIANRKNYRKGEHLFYQDEPLDRIFFLTSGRIKAYRIDPTGKEQIMTILNAGDFFPHIGFYGKKTFPVNTTCLDASQIMVIRKDHFEKLLLSYPVISVKLIQNLGEKIQELQNRLESQILNNAYQQVIKLLLRFAADTGVIDINGRTTIFLDLSNQDLGKMIGASRETVSRTLTKLTNNNLITKLPKHRLSFKREELMEQLYLDEE